MIIIYKITNLLNSKIYIGMTTKSITERLQSHVNHSKKPEFRLHKAIKKHGEENFRIEKICTATTQEQANELEREWIAKLDSTNYDIGYNMSLGGSGKSIALSEDIKKKISMSVKAHRNSMTVEEKKEMTKAANQVKLGYKESENSKKLKSIAQTKRWKNATHEQRRLHGKISNEKISEEGRKKSILALNTAYSPQREPGIPKEKVTCPHCGKTGGKPIMVRYHFDNCKDIVK
jgi:group I intron endonuclease